MKLLQQKCIELGAYKAAVIAVEHIVFDRSFRAQCEANACGKYGTNYMCPPDVGEIDALIARAQQYRRALVFQTVTPLEDSYDFEGMMEAQAATHRLMRRLGEEYRSRYTGPVLMLGAGGCGVCEKCAKQSGQPCRSPQLAMPSLEAYGINVSQLAQLAGMKYINGQNTVTYFGAILDMGSKE